MKFLNRFILIFFLSLLNITSSSSGENIAFADIDFIIKNSNIGKSTLIEINNLNKKNITDLKKKDQILLDLEIEIKNKKNIVSEKAFNEEVLKFQKKIKEFSEKKNKTVLEFNNYKRKELKDVFKQISPIIDSFMDANSINILLDSKNVFMGKNTLNVTNKILLEINKVIK